MCGLSGFVTMRRRSRRTGVGQGCPGCKRAVPGGYRAPLFAGEVGRVGMGGAVRHGQDGGCEEGGGQAGSGERADEIGAVRPSGRRAPWGEEWLRRTCREP
ncbi:hypothetical protein Sm713_41270 [Streptomyces sp. TS71-3]|nr:hypothetical protein Sm713_41270 [Streptomyces sp. TS71-3]